MKKFIMFFILFFGMVVFNLQGQDYYQHLPDKKWQMGGMIHFEEESGNDFLGVLEINQFTKDVLKKYYDIKTDTCANNAKIYMKIEDGNCILKHREEAGNSEVVEEMHSTLLYTSKRADDAHEILPEVFENLCQIDNSLSSPPSVEEVANVYHKIIKPGWEFEISDVLFFEAKNANAILFKLLYDGRDEIVNAQEKSISGNFLHMALVIVDYSIVPDTEKIDLIVSELKEKFLHRKIKVGNKNGLADLEFGLTGSKAKDRIRPSKGNQIIL